MFFHNIKYQAAWDFESSDIAASLRSKEKELRDLFLTTTLAPTTEQVTPVLSESHEALSWKSIVANSDCESLLSAALTRLPIINIGSGINAHETARELRDIGARLYVAIDGYEPVENLFDSDPSAIGIEAGMISSLRAVRNGSCNIYAEWICDYRSADNALGAEDCYKEILRVVPAQGLLMGLASDVLSLAFRDNHNWRLRFRDDKFRKRPALIFERK